MINENTTVHGNENVEPGDETQITAPGLPGGRGRTGKVARLPLGVRKELNRRRTPPPVDPGVTEV
jgi:hypothetical protein